MKIFWEDVFRDRVLHFRCHVSLVSFGMEQFQSLSFFLFDILQKSAGQLFCKMFFSLSDVSSWMEGVHFGRD